MSDCQYFELQDVAFSYQSAQQQVLKNVNLNVSKGDRIALTGSNGSGKSTLLRVLVGLLKPTAGQLKAFGRHCVSEKDFHVVRTRAGLLFQDPEDQLFCPTVQEDVAFGPLNLGKNRDEAIEVVARTLQLLGLQGYENRITHHLSGGEKRMVALATVLAMQPDVLLLDEPTCGIDEPTELRLQKILSDLPQTMIIVSHDRPFLKSTCNRFIQLQGGAIAAV